VADASSEGQQNAIEEFGSAHARFSWSPRLGKEESGSTLRRACEAPVN
jgi:hypothetical protein